MDRIHKWQSLGTKFEYSPEGDRQIYSLKQVATHSSLALKDFTASIAECSFKIQTGLVSKGQSSSRGGWAWRHQFPRVAAYWGNSFSNFCFVLFQWAMREECVTYDDAYPTSSGLVVSRHQHKATTWCDELINSYLSWWLRPIQYLWPLHNGLGMPTLISQSGYLVQKKLLFTKSWSVVRGKRE